ncbi:MAG TPA: peptidylprolyl isomerase [Actinomycetota bacterium]|nr:peptidylprolyl isomerase [Actinomycetota bacterium]
MRLIKFLALTAALVALIGCNTQTAGNYFAPTAAIVNGEKLPEGRISLELRRVVNNPQDPESAGQFSGVEGRANRLEAQRQVLTRLIQQTIILQRARALKIKATKAEVQGRIAELKRRFGSEQEYQEAVKREGFTDEEVEEFLANQVIVDKVVEEVTKGSAPTEEEVVAQFEQNRLVYDAQLHLAHILVCKNFDPEQGSCAHIPEDETTAQTVSDRARAGEEFAALAREFSVDTQSKESGGDLGFQDPSRLSPELAGAVGALQPGEVSPPVRTQFGFHVLKLLARGRTLDAARQEILDELGSEGEQEAFSQWLTGELKKANVRVNPKFGVFDRTVLEVVPSKEQLSEQPPPQPLQEERLPGQP